MSAQYIMIGKTAPAVANAPAKDEPMTAQEIAKAAEAKAKDEKAKVSRRVSWISKENYVVQKAEYYDRQNNLFKALTCENIEKVNGYWTIQKMTMKNVQTNHQTVYELQNIKFDIPVDANYFTVSALEREMVK